MTGRGTKTYYRTDNGKAITDEDAYTMLMLHKHQNMSMDKIARRFSISSTDARVIIGKSIGGYCCG
jgi:hypothetical protein